VQKRDGSSSVALLLLPFWSRSIGFCGLSIASLGLFVDMSHELSSSKWKILQH